jgi:hypothetical protein
MYATLIAVHSLFRWLVLASLGYAILGSLAGLLARRPYTKADNIARIVANAISHTQLLLGFTLYFAVSPITGQFLKNGAGGNSQTWFFGVYHIAGMFLSIVVMTIGGSVAKKAKTDPAKFKAIAIYFSLALLLILLAIPWFRPYFRNF